MEYILELGFDIKAKGESDDPEIIFVLGKGKTQCKKRSISNEKRKRARGVRVEIEEYSRRILKNRKQIKDIVRKLEEESIKHKIVIWGGGRILNSLFEFGGLDGDIIYRLVDKYLHKYVDKIFEVDLLSPEELKKKIKKI